MKKGKIISVFAGLGKTTVGNIFSNAFDLQSSTYRCDYTNIHEDDYENMKCAEGRVSNPDWPENYLAAIKEAKEKYDIVLVPSNIDIREMLIKNNIDFVFVLPSLDARDMLIKRYQFRGNNEDMIKNAMLDFDNWSRDQKDYPYKIEILPENQYLKDMLVERGYL